MSLVDMLFTCPHYPGGLRLLPGACATRWRKAQTADPLGPGYRCRQCPVGAGHAGEPVTQPVHGAGRCSWCGRLNGRLVLRHCICVSCYNRVTEIARQTGRRGRPPLKRGLALFRVVVPDA